LLVRAEAFAALGGFRAGWRTGEDVDFCWRLAESGRRLFYWPTGAVRHDHRTGWRGFLSRKRDYARSEGPLSRVHPRRFALQPDTWIVDLSLLLLGAALAIPGDFRVLRCGLGFAALVLILSPDAVHIARAARHWPWTLQRLPFTALVGAAGRQMLARLLRQSRWVMRHLALPLLLVCLVMPALWPIGAGILALGTTGEWLARQPPVAKLEFALGWIAECLAYSLGWLEGLLIGRWNRWRR
jgi:hypothetical protein